MASTGKLGTFLSRPGHIALGAPNANCVAWQGPFGLGELYEGGMLVNVTKLAGASTPVSVTPMVASQIAKSDPTWWAYS